MYILVPDLDESAVKESTERFRSVVTGGGGTVTEENIWGRRKMEYEIHKHREGFYVLLRFEADAAVPRELDRVLGLDDRVLRRLIVRDEVRRQAKAARDSRKEKSAARSAAPSTAEARGAPAGKTESGGAAGGSKEAGGTSPSAAVEGGSS
jgi:small subunit ribosomal protein S6